MGMGMGIGQGAKTYDMWIRACDVDMVTWLMLLLAVEEERAARDMLLPTLLAPRVPGSRGEVMLLLGLPMDLS